MTRSLVHCLAFTHVAAQNLEIGHTILHFLHRHAKSKRLAIIVDEASLVPENCWALLGALRWTGNVVVCLGDFEGQLMSIADQHKDDAALRALRAAALCTISATASTSN